jgi:hypothetical protein
VSQLLADVLSRSAATLIGILLFVATTVSLMRTVVVPRALRSTISDAVSAAVVGTATLFSRLRRSYRWRDSVLAWVGPTILLCQLLTWLLLFLIACGLLIYGVGGHESLGDSMRQAGSSLLTLGFAAVNTEDQTVIDFMAAATGPIVVALMIGFLPTIYSTYLDREVEVSALTTAGGEPAWGPELLSRFTIGDDLDYLPSAFMSWAGWATRLRLTHHTYPVLIWVRSVRARRHYAVTLLALMDAAALRLSLQSAPPHREAFAVLVEGGHAMQILYESLFGRRNWRQRLGFMGPFDGESARMSAQMRRLPAWNRRQLALQVASDVDTVRGMNAEAIHALVKGVEAPLQITRADFDLAVEVLLRSGFPIDRDLDEAWTQFATARGRYEFAAYEVCRRLDAVAAPWTGPRNVPTPTLWPTSALSVLQEPGFATGAVDPGDEPDLPGAPG